MFNLVTGPRLQAVVAFGNKAKDIVNLWPGHGGVPVFEIAHPSSYNPIVLLNEWRAAVTALRAIVTPDSKAKAKMPNYDTSFVAADYVPIPRADLPFGVAPHLGDDSWVRALNPMHPTSVERPQPDDRHTLIWKAPTS